MGGRERQWRVCSELWPSETLEGVGQITGMTAELMLNGCQHGKVWPSSNWWKRESKVLPECGAEMPKPTRGAICKLEARA